MKLQQVGGVYEFRGGNGSPPPEIAKLLGLKEKKIKPSKSKQSTMNTSRKQERIEPIKSEKSNVDELEKSLIMKYRSSAYKAFLEEVEMDEDENKDVNVSNVDKSKYRLAGPSGNRGFGSYSSENNNEETIEFDESFPDEADMKEPVIKSKKSLFERIKESKLIKLSQGSEIEEVSSQKQITKAWERPNRPLENKVIDENRIKSKQNEPIKPATIAMPDESNYRFRKPIESLSLPVPNAIETLKKVKYVRSEEEKNQFKPFDFIMQDDNDKKSDIFSDIEFSEIIEDPTILKNIESMGISQPTKIQEKAIPVLLQPGNAIIMQAQTGSGKSLGFLIPLINLIDKSADKVQVVILAPSRELVSQITSVSERLFRNMDIRTLAIIGGANVKNQISRLREDKPHIVVATPGRLAELVFGLEKLRLGNVRCVIVDEIDNMLDEPFVDELQTILEATPVFKQKSNENKMNDLKASICFASATGNDPIVNRFLERLPIPVSSWQHISVDTGSMLPSTITHGLISTPRIRALEFLKRFLNAKPSIKSALIFVNDPHRVEIICDQLLEMGMIAAPLHGESSKDDRKVSANLAECFKVLFSEI